MVEDEPEGWGWRFRFIVAAFLLGNALGFTLLGPRFIVIGWLLNVPCGLLHYFALERPNDLHYFALERPNDSGDPLGTAMIVAMPWAQFLLTSIVFGLGGTMMLWQALFGTPTDP
jgi:hypothetical protein